MFAANRNRERDLPLTVGWVYGKKMGLQANLVLCVIGVAELADMISWERVSIDGSFAAGKGGS